MKQSFKVEIWKATHNTYFIVSLLVGVILVLCNVLATYANVSDLTNRSIACQNAGLPVYRFTGCSLFIWWIAHNGINFGSVYFFQIWPIVASLPFSWSLATEGHSGAIVQFLTRTNRRRWYISKYLAVFFSGGIAMASPLLLDLLINALICPAEPLMFANALTTVTNRSFLSNLFFSHPWIHALLWCGMDYLFGGAAAVLTFFLGTRIRKSIAAILFPFSIMYACSIFSDTLKELFGTALELNPIQLAMQAPLGINPGWLLFVFLTFPTLTSFFCGYRRVVNDDIL